MATSQQRELMAQIEQLGYTYRGHDRQNAVVMWHPEAGAVRIHATSSDNRYAMNKVREARRRIRQAEAAYGKFVEWLMQRHGVGKTEQQELSINAREEAEAFINQHPDVGRASSLLQQVEKDDRIEVLQRRQGSRTWKIRLTGPDYGLETLLADTPTPTSVEAEGTNNGSPMEAVIDQLRSMMLAEMNGELEDLRAKNELTIDTLGNLLAALKESQHGSRVVG